MSHSQNEYRQKLRSWVHEKAIDTYNIHIDDGIEVTESHKSVGVRETNAHIVTDQTDHIYIICNKCFYPKQLRSKKIGSELTISCKCTHCNVEKGKWKVYRRLIMNNEYPEDKFT